MNGEHCPREVELLDALGRGFVGAELAAHAASCPACGELRGIAGALLDDRVQAMAAAPVPSAGTMWWRLQVRRRREAEAAARRSLLIGQTVTMAVAIAFVVSLFGAPLAFAMREFVAAVWPSTPLLLALAGWVLVIPIAGWAAWRQK